MSLMETLLILMFFTSYSLKTTKFGNSEPILCADEEDSRSNTLKQHATGDTGLKETGTSNKRPISTTCSSTGMVFRFPFQDMKKFKAGAFRTVWSLYSSKLCFTSSGI
ncbi:BAF_HP2_G0015640.mRNA.1.CDS.1 [Saccharomyces cerevisiae]|nr:BAF_HP2_G0015640.mRNA.1.CDS.1 [Saccharomyces cerevisiae]CAI6598994.1 BAF_HP2_G0015640.mRNA.1.CDS.1 [Saccharomyces cerevisiae]